MRLLATIFAFVLLATSAAYAEKRVALVIGNKDYKSGVGALTNPLNDIRLVSDALKSVDFEVLKPVENGTRGEMLSAIYAFASTVRAAGPDAVGFLYYSGHGVASQGENYLIPIDVSEPSTEQLRIQGVRQSEVLEILRAEAPNAAHYLVLDACRNTLQGERGGKGFVAVGQQSGVLVAFSTEPGHTARDTGVGSGPYAAALAAELTKPTTPDENDLNMFHYVRVGVIERTKGDQVPWTEDGIQRRERPVFARATPGAPKAARSVSVAISSSDGRPLTREEALGSAPRVAISTPTLKGSIPVRGNRIDDLSFVKPRDADEAKSPTMDLLSPSNSPHPFYAELGWATSYGVSLKLPGPDTTWRAEGSNGLDPAHPLMLVYDNGEGLEFRRTIQIDDNYLFTIRDEVTNKTSAPIVLYHFALISRHGTPEPIGYLASLFGLGHRRGLMGVLGESGIQDVSYERIERDKRLQFNASNAWVGMTSQSVATALVPDKKSAIQAAFSFGELASLKLYQADYLEDRVIVSPGETAAALNRLYAGPRDAGILGNYEKVLRFESFSRLAE
jgi:YidC/Oxa1 family membrane protein insertase